MVHLKAPESGVGWSVGPSLTSLQSSIRCEETWASQSQGLDWSGDAVTGQHYIRLKSEVSHFNLEMILTQDHKSTFISYEYFCVVVLCDEKCTYIIKEKFIFLKSTPESS